MGISLSAVSREVYFATRLPKSTQNADGIADAKFAYLRYINSHCDVLYLSFSLASAGGGLEMRLFPTNHLPIAPIVLRDTATQRLTLF